MNPVITFGAMNANTFMMLTFGGVLSAQMSKSIMQGRINSFTIGLSYDLK
jgi:hypothetical protein